MCTCGRTRHRILDLFVGGGGTAEGWRQAGFDVVGVDKVQRRDFPPGVEFIKADVLEVIRDVSYLATFCAIHASPPCKVFTRLGHLVAAAGKTPIHGDMVDATRDALEASGRPYVIENVEGAPIRPDVVLCGSMFPDLRVHADDGVRWLRRHRLFELGGWGALGWGIQPEPCCACQSGCTAPMCGHRLAGSRPLGVYGSLADEVPDGGQTARTLEEARTLMAMPWASWASLTQAIPPPYTRYLGTHLLDHLEAVAA